MAEMPLTQRWFPFLRSRIAFLLIHIVGDDEQLRMVQVIGKLLALIGGPFGCARLCTSEPWTENQNGANINTFQALDNGTTWSMSTSLACVQVLPS